MEPLSITTGCVSLLTGISRLSIQIGSFVSSVRDARKDMDAVTRELSSLSLCLETLRDDSLRINYPTGLRDNLLIVLKNCETVTSDISTVLYKLVSANIVRKIQWTITGRDEIDKLRSSLESHKSALGIALDMTSLLLLSHVKDDIADIKADTGQIETLVHQIGLLRLELNIKPINDARTEHLQRFLDESTSYAETVIDQAEHDDDDEIGMSTLSVAASPEFTSALSSTNKIFQRSNNDIGMRHSYHPTATPYANQEIQQDIASDHSDCTPEPEPLVLLPIRDKKAIRETEKLRATMTPEERVNIDQQLLDAVQGTFSMLDRAKISFFERLRSSDHRRSYTMHASRTPVDIKHLLESGADPNTGWEIDGCQYLDLKGNNRTFEQNHGIRKLLLMRGARFKPSDASSWFLHDATMGDIDMVQAFLDCGVSLEAVDSYGETAVTKASRSNHFEIVKMLLTRGAVANQLAMLTAAAHGNNEIVALLLEHGASPNAGSDNTNALCEAARNRRLATVILLMNQGARVDASPKRGIVWFAVVKDNMEVIKLLIDHGASPDAELGGITALRRAVSSGWLDIVQLLLDQGAVVHSQDAEAMDDPYSLADCTELTKDQIRRLVLTRYKMQKQHRAATQAKVR